MKAVFTLTSHNAQVNSIAWAPDMQSHICTAGDDSQTIIWGLNRNDQPNGLFQEGGAMPQENQNFEEPQLVYGADGPVHQLLWCSTRSKWISIAYENKVQVLRI